MVPGLQSLWSNQAKAEPRPYAQTSAERIRLTIGKGTISPVPGCRRPPYSSLSPFSVTIEEGSLRYGTHARMFHAWKRLSRARELFFYDTVPGLQSPGRTEASYTSLGLHARIFDVYRLSSSERASLFDTQMSLAPL